MITEKGEWNKRALIRTWIKLDSYKNLKPILQVSAICFDNEGKMLLVRDPGGGFWTIPGGTPEGEESAERTLIREVEEEATCDLEKPKLLGAIKVNFLDNGEELYQLRYAAKIKKIKEQTEDPDRGHKLERVFIEPRDYFKYTGYDKLIGAEIVKVAKRVLKIS